MKKFKLVLFFLFAFYARSFAQSFYVNTPIDPYDYYAGNAIYRVTKTGSTFTSQLINTCFPGDQFFSIAANKNGFYWFDAGQIFTGTLSGNSLTNCRLLTTTSVGTNALTIGSDGKLYYSGGSLYSTDTQTLQFNNLGPMSNLPSGDLVFYDGNLYMAASSGAIVKVDTKNTSASAPYISTGNLSIFGLVTVPVSLHKNTVYALVNAPSFTTDIVEIDMDNKVVLGVIGNLPYSILDAASINEDGSIQGILIDAVKVHQDCNAPTKGIIEVTTKPSMDDPLTYTLSNGLSNTTGIFTGVPQGTYLLKVTSPDDEQDQTVTVPAYSLVKPTYKYTIERQICYTPGQVTFSTPDANTAYTVSSSTGTFPLNHTFAGLTNAQSYHFDILNDNGCIVDHVDITIPRDKCQIQPDPAVVAKECTAANKGSITVVTEPHPDAYTYTLNGTSNSTGVFNMLNPGSYTIDITSPDDAKSITAAVPDYRLSNPAVTYIVTNPICGLAGKVKFNSPNNGLYTVQSDATTYPMTTEITGFSAGTHHFTVLDQQGCVAGEFDIPFAQDKCTIKFNSVDVAQQCNAINQGVIQVLTGTHQDQYSYTLNGTSNTSGIFTNLDAGTYTISITSAEDALTVQAVVPDYKLLAPTITYTTNNPVCAAKGNITFNIQNSALYKINYAGSEYSSDHVFAGLSPGKYHFFILKQDGCIVDEYDIVLLYQPCPVVIDKIDVTAECNILGKGVIQVICPPIPETYRYTLDNSITNSTGIFNLLDPGTYQLFVSASGGGTTQSRTILVPDFRLDKPVTVINQSNPVCEIPGQLSFTIDNNSGLYSIQYNGSLYPSDHIFSGLSVGNYSFSILKKDGCIADMIPVTLIQEVCSPVSFPSAFTPNNDGINDIFRANPQSKATGFRLQIYDRWGALLFTTFDLYDGWNGEYKGKRVAVGTYYWIATFTAQDKKPVTQSGYVALIK